jgi:hypothetical protein
MNAVTFYREQVDWILGHVTDADMFLVQSVVTCGALFWFVSSCHKSSPVHKLTKLAGSFTEHG